MSCLSLDMCRLIQDLLYHSLHLELCPWNITAVLHCWPPRKAGYSCSVPSQLEPLDLFLVVSKTAVSISHSCHLKKRRIFQKENVFPDLTTRGDIPKRESPRSDGPFWERSMEDNRGINIYWVCSVSLIFLHI